MSEKKYGWAPIAILVGSINDLLALYESGIMQMLEAAGVSVELHIISADRNYPEIDEFCRMINEADNYKTKVVVVAAGLSAQITLVASRIDIPVIGVPLKGGDFGVKDSLLSMLSKPKGTAIVIASGATDQVRFYNAVVYALKMLAMHWPNYSEARLMLKQIKAQMNNDKLSETNISTERLKEIYDKLSKK